MLGSLLGEPYGMAGDGARLVNDQRESRMLTGNAWSLVSASTPRTRLLAHAERRSRSLYRLLPENDGHSEDNPRPDRLVEVESAKLG